MKLIGILWNMVDNPLQVEREISKYCNIKTVINVDLKGDFEPFLRELYPDLPGEEDKALSKIKTLKKYKNRNINILIIDINSDEKVFLKQKNKMMYKNVLDLKVNIRRKFKYLLNESCNSSYDNIFHLSDDSSEFIDDFYIIIKYLSKHLERCSNFIRIDDFVDENLISQEHRGTREKLWLNDKCLYKKQTIDTLEAYSELFNMYYMKKFGLSDGADYIPVNYNDADGVITKRLNTEDENLVFVHKILKEYGYVDKKEIIIHNNLQELPLFIRDYCNRNNFEYDVDLTLKLKKLFLYDILTCQNDRNPTNLCLIIDRLKKAKLSYFDNSNMLIFDKSDNVEKYKKNSLFLKSFLNDGTSTFLINKPSDIKYTFNNKMIHLESFLKNFDTYDMKLLQYMISNFNKEEIEANVFDIQQQYNITFPDVFVDAMYDYCDIIKPRILRKIERFNR